MSTAFDDYAAILVERVQARKNGKSTSDLENDWDAELEYLWWALSPEERIDMAGGIQYEN